MTTITAIADFAPDSVEAGVGLALQDEQGRYLFFLAGTRHRCPPGELFYAGIGGHREPGEDWVACAHREAAEEIHAQIALRDAAATFYLPHNGNLQQVHVHDQPRPLALYEMIHPPGAPREGQIYRIVIYNAHLQTAPCDFPLDEVQSILLLSSAQVMQGVERKPTLATLISEGAELINGAITLQPDIRLYPIGTAKALALILRHMEMQ